MSGKHRDMVDEHLVRRDEEGYSLDHALVSDINRCLLKEMADTAKLLHRIRRHQQWDDSQYQTYGEDITTEQIEALLSNEIKKKHMNEKKKSETRKLIQYNDLFI